MRSAKALRWIVGSTKRIHTSHRPATPARAARHAAPRPATESRGHHGRSVTSDATAANVAQAGRDVLERGNGFDFRKIQGRPETRLVEMVRHLLRESLEATISGKIGYVLAKNAFLDFKKRVDYSEYGGGPLLGVRGVCIICHGRSNANAIKNAIRVAKEFLECRVSQRIEEELKPVGQDRIPAKAD